MKNNCIKAFFLFLVWILLLPNAATAQLDSLILSNGNVIVGEIKEMDKGVLVIETEYSDSDFKIEWGGIKEMYTYTYFFITLSDGSRYNGSINSYDSVQLEIDLGLEEMPIVALDEIVYLKSVDTGFWSRLSASIDIGMSYTKANNLEQLNIRSGLGYLADRWSVDLKYDMVSSKQDNTEDINRVDSDIRYKLFLPRDWYALAELDFLSNTEQKLDLRTNTKAGIGKFLLHTNRKYFGFQGGLSFNHEKFSEDNGIQRSVEGFFGAELNLFDMGDLSLFTNITAYPSFTQAQRWRTDFKWDLKYDLPLDFYIKFGYTLNYDNQPAQGAPESDFVVQMNFGWEL